MAKNDGRGRRDAAGIGPYLREGARLASMRKLDWRVADADADVRGWEVRTVSGRVVGTVYDLLVDEDVREVVLLDVDLAGSSRRGLVPIRAAEIDRARRVILVDSADVRDADEFSTAARAAGHEGIAQRDSHHDAALRESAHRVVTEGNTVRSVPRAEYAGETGALPAAPMSSAPPPAPSADLAADAPHDPVVIEEVVVRRRVVDAADLPAEEARGARVIRDDGSLDERLG